MLSLSFVAFIALPCQRQTLYLHTVLLSVIFKIRDGGNSSGTLLATLCNSYPGPSHFRSSGTQLWVEYKSTQASNSFEASFKKLLNPSCKLLNPMHQWLQFILCMLWSAIVLQSLWRHEDSTIHHLSRVWKMFLLCENLLIGVRAGGGGGTSQRLQFNYFSNDSSFIRCENGERLRSHPDFNPHAFGHCVIFWGQESHRQWIYFLSFCYLLLAMVLNKTTRYWETYTRLASIF